MRFYVNAYLVSLVQCVKLRKMNVNRDLVVTVEPARIFLELLDVDVHLDGEVGFFLAFYIKLLHFLPRLNLYVNMVLGYYYSSRLK